MNKFTLIIHNKGWSVDDACKYWAIRYKTYNARCNNPKMFNQLECMCIGLSDKLGNGLAETINKAWVDKYKDQDIYEDKLNEQL